MTNFKSKERLVVIKYYDDIDNLCLIISSQLLIKDLY